MITRTVLSNCYQSTFFTYENRIIVPEVISRFSPGTRVEVHLLSEGKFAVQPISGDPQRIFGEERWIEAV